MPKLVLFLILTTALPLSFLSADTIELRNGKRIEGKVVSQTRFSIRFRSAEGVKVYAKSAIRRIQFGSTAPKPDPKKEAELRRKRQELLRKRQEARRKKQQAALEKQREAAAANDKASASKGETGTTEKQPAPEETRKPPRPVSKKPRPPPRPAAGPAWLSLLVPGRQQLQQERKLYGGLLGGGWLLGLLGTFAMEQQRIEAAQRYQALDRAVSLAVLTDAGGSLDLALSFQRDTVATRYNEATVLQNYSLVLLAAVYSVNSLDILVFDRGRGALRLEMAPAGAGLAYEFRF